MYRTIGLLALVCTFFVSGCYHTTVLTGKPESNKVVQKDWHLIFVYGLVPIGDVDVSSECPSGVAKVETQHTVLNQVVAFLTGGLLTPVQVKATCAAADTAEALIEADDDGSALQRAAAQSLRQGEPTYARLR